MQLWYQVSLSKWRVLLHCSLWQHKKLTQTPFILTLLTAMQKRSKGTASDIASDIISQPQETYFETQLTSSWNSWLQSKTILLLSVMFSKQTGHASPSWNTYKGNGWTSFRISASSHLSHHYSYKSIFSMTSSSLSLKRVKFTEIATMTEARYKFFSSLK